MSAPRPTLRINSWENACAPKALARLFGTSYEHEARRIHQAGGNHHSVTAEAFRELLRPFGIAQELTFANPPLFHRLRRKMPGYWVVVVTGQTFCGETSSHCVTLKYGSAMDNGWIPEQQNLSSRRVYAAWRIKSLQPAQIHANIG